MQRDLGQQGLAGSGDNTLVLWDKLSVDETTVLQTIFWSAAVSRLAVADPLADSKSKANSLIASLLDQGLLEETGLQGSIGGRRPETVQLRQRLGVLIGADLGATRMDVAVMNPDVSVRARIAEPADMRRGPGVVLARARTLMRPLLTESGVSPRQVIAIGFGVPGPVDFASAQRVNPPLMPNWDSFSIRDYLREEYAAPVFVDNDVKLMALGESQDLVARDIVRDWGYCMQFDLFNDSQNVVLRNDVVHALERCDAEAARSACASLREKCPGDEQLDALQLLVEAVADRSDARLQTHAALHAARHDLQDRFEPAARRVLSNDSATHWLRARWQALAQRADLLAFDPNHAQDHAAPLYLRAGQWQAAADAVAAITSWRRIPTPLFWMVQARLQLLGLQSSWAMLAELAWLSPARLDELVPQAIDPTLGQLMHTFQARFEGEGEVGDLAWFPAWLLTERPGLVSLLSQAQASQHSDPEKAMRVMVELLGLERQGRHHDVVARRKTLRGLHASLYAAYMATR